MKIPPLCKSYGSRKVLDLPELELREGRICALIGPNGCGKSTLGRLLSGIELPDSGASPLPGIKVGYMPQRSFPFRMSVEKNLALSGAGKASQRAMLHALGLEPLAKCSAKGLSGGECARMALGRILLGSYQLLILDEPCAAMDMESTLAAEKAIAAHCRDSGCALLLITHSLQQARRLAHDALYLDGGKLVEQGEAALLLSRPQKEQTKRFLDFYGL